jgi:hypothetical protein
MSQVKTLIFFSLHQRTNARWLVLVVAIVDIEISVVAMQHSLPPISSKDLIRRIKATWSLDSLKRLPSVYPGLYATTRVIRYRAGRSELTT